MLSKIDLSKSDTAFADTRPHYALLDGLRGVAALLVLWYHVFEGYAFASGSEPITVINHGYLAVDFFFILSGFVISYAYDKRWQRGTLTMRGFFCRRLIRLHPMVVMGAVIGLVCYFIQGGTTWDGTHVASSLVMLALLCAMFFIPALPGSCYDVRGNGEMFPLNGPAWSLFFEYIGNLLYALLVRHLSDRALAVLVGLLGVALAWFTVSDAAGYGMFGVGWTLDGLNFIGGSVRMLFPFTMGMLLQRHFRPVAVRGAFWICAAVLVAIFHVPYIAPVGGLCLNGVYEAACIIIVFPILIWLAASGATTDRFSTRTCTFLGDISFPLYIVHYPLMYIFYAWLIETKRYTPGETWPQALATCVGSIVLAYACLKLYDIPLRRWLTARCRRWLRA